MKYKYKVGQKIEYEILETISEICPHCKHKEVDYSVIKVSGVIVKRYYDINMMRPMGMETEKEILPNGNVIHHPRFKTLQLATEEPFYDIERDGGELDEGLVEEGINK